MPKRLWTVGCLRRLRVAAACFLSVVVIASFTVASASGQPWGERTDGPVPGDGGPRIDAIQRRELLNIAESPARLEDGSRVIYNHPSMLCFTRKGTLIFMWNGGSAEGEGGNRIFSSRLEKGEDDWSEPQRLESTQIDFGDIFQPSAEGAPVIAGYWLGPPPRSGAALRISEDDGKTWSDRMPFPRTDDPFWQGPPAGGHYRFSMNPPIEFPDGTLWWPSERFRNRSLRDAVPAIVVVPPDNYTGRAPQGTPWRSLHPPVFERGGGYLGDFLILSQDYNRILYATRGGGTYLTEDRGKTWQKIPNVPHAGGGAGLAALSLDVEGGPAQGWHVMAGTPHPGRNGMRLHVSKTPTDPDSWRKVLVLHQDIPAEDADPSMIQHPETRRIHLLFTGRGEDRLKHYVLDPDVLIREAPPASPPTSWLDPPSELRARVDNEGRVHLEWKDNADNETGFVIWRKYFEEGHRPEIIAELDADVTRYTDPEAIPGRRYGYKVRAVNERFESRYSNAATVTVPRDETDR